MTDQNHYAVSLRTFLGRRILELAEEGAALTSVRECADVVGLALSHDAEVVAIPVARLDAKFFRLSTGFAGDVLQKFANYRLRVAILGDPFVLAEQSEPLRDFIRESNRGRAVWFLCDWESFEDKLKRESNAGYRPWESRKQ
jgi:Domain of unknown function (DUF4180)